MVNSKYAMTTICNILMNLVVLENKVVEEAHIFYHLLKFIMNTLPSIENNGEVCLCAIVFKLKVELNMQNVSGACTLWQSWCSRPLDSSETHAETKVHRLLHLQVHPGCGQIPLGRPQL